MKPHHMYQDGPSTLYSEKSIYLIIFRYVEFPFRFMTRFRVNVAKEPNIFQQSLNK